MKTRKNIMDWTGDVPVGVLPFFVWTAAHKLSYNDMIDKAVFEKLYADFVVTMNYDDTAEFKDWCHEQFIHHYECNK